ncbi:MAG: hypothetical protein ACRDS1_14200 [Pseudonocardiaceae bacterium]
MTFCSHDIDIDTSPDHARRYLEQVPNLPAWTEFFRAVGERHGEYYRVESVMGPIDTRISRYTDGDVAVCTVHSLIRGQREQAVIRIRPAGTGVNVAFTIQLPETAPAELTAVAAATLHRELTALKAILEHHVVRTGAESNPGVSDA